MRPDPRGTTRSPGPRGVLPLGVLAGLVLVSALFAAPALVDAVDGTPPPFAGLARPLSYLVAAPLFGIWDSLSLLSLTQHYATLLTLVSLYVAVRLRAQRGGERSLLARLGAESARGVAAFLGLLGFYAAGVFLPRPMVALELGAPELLSVDFHSHTRHSHDGWKRFTAERNRAWHEGGGFDVAYVTDHYTWRGVDDAAEANPTRVGDGTALLSGAEIRIHLRPTNILGDRERYLFALDGDSLYMDPDALRASADPTRRPPTLLYTMPGQLRYVVPYSAQEPSGVVGIEINDGSPRGLEQVRGERAEILALADSADLALIGASNLHGWGRVVSSWSVLRIPGWRDMTPGQVGDAIEREIHAKRRGSVTVLERRMPHHGGSAVRLALTVPWLSWEHMRMLSPAERLSWLLWLASTAAVLILRTPRRPETAVVQGEPG